MIVNRKPEDSVNRLVAAHNPGECAIKFFFPGLGFKLFNRLVKLHLALHKVQHIGGEFFQITENMGSNQY